MSTRRMNESPVSKAPATVKPAPTRIRSHVRYRAALVLGLALLACGLPLSAQVCGDCNSNGAVDINDVLLITQHTAGTSMITGPRLMECDVNRSGTIDVLDVLLATQVTAGLLPQTSLDCTTCGDCNLNGTTYDGTDIDMIPPFGSVQVTTSGQAACDTDGDGILGTADFVLFAPGAHTCSTCGDCDQNGSVDFGDVQRAHLGIAPASRSFDACNIRPSKPTSIDVLDALQISRFDAGLLTTLACYNPVVVQP